MTLALLIVATVAVVNAPRVRSALPSEEPVLVGALGAAATLVALLPVAGFAGPLTDGLDLTAPTVRMAAGVVLLVFGAVTAVAGPPPAEPRLPGRRAGLVPVAFPVLLTPGVGLLVLAGALDRSAPVAVAVAALALATVPLVAVVGSGSRALDAVWLGAGRVLAAVVVLAGMGLLMDGLFDL